MYCNLENAFAYQLFLNRFFLIIRFVVFAVLSLAVITKIRDARAILAADTLLSHVPLLYTAIGIESFTGVYVLFAPVKRAWIITVSLFIALTCFNIIARFSNQECSCFGDFIPGEASIFINFAVLAGMVITWPVFKASRQPRQDYPTSFTNEQLRSSVFATLIGVISSCVSLGFLAYSINHRQDNSDMRFLLANDFTTPPRQWPVGPKFHPELARLYKGEWLVLVLKHDCDHCKALAEQLTAYLESNANSELQILTFVSDGQRWVIHFDKATIEASSDLRFEWKNRDEPFFAAPAVFHVKDGEVIGAKDGNEAPAYVRDVVYNQRDVQIVN